MKLIKWFLAILVTLALLVTLYLTVFFDPNDFKPEIVNAVKKQTGRELVIADDLSWTFFLRLALTLEAFHYQILKGLRLNQCLM